MLTIAENPAYKNAEYAEQIKHYVTKKATLAALKEANITKIQEIFNNTTFKSELYFTHHGITKKQRNSIAKETCDKTYTMKSHIQKILGTVREIKVLQNKEHFYFDEEYQAYEAFIDETFEKKKAAYGVYYKRGSIFNFFD